MLLVAILFLALPASFGWGDNAERMIVDKAVDTLPDEMLPFFQANRGYLMQHVTDPLQSEARTPAEEPKGFIQLDHYGPYPYAALPRTYTAAQWRNSAGGRSTRTVCFPGRSASTARSLPTRCERTTGTTRSFPPRFWLTTSPLRTIRSNLRSNSDGVLSGQQGINERFGVGLVDRYQRFFFMKPNEAAFIRDPTDHAFEMSLDAHSWLENVLIADRRAHEGLTGNTSEYYDRFYAQAGAVLIRQLTDAATDTGSYWMTAWINAGRPQLPGS